MAYNKVSDFKELIIEKYEQGFKAREIAEFLQEEHGDFGILQSSIERLVRDVILKKKRQFNSDADVVAENVRLAKQKQRLQDVQRIERKAFREEARIENAVGTIGRALLEVNQKYATKLAEKVNISELIKSDELDGVGVIQTTDVHFNELIDLPHNKYDFKVAAKRLKKLTQESIEYFKYKKVKRVLMAYTGDLLNSDRRLDEIISAETNRAKAAALGAHIIRQQILHVRNAGYEVDVVSVLGNESRVNKEMTFSNEAFSDNYDFTIMAQVRDVITNMGIDGINFLSIDKMETIVKMGAYNVLFSHGINLLNSKQKDIQSVIGKYNLQGHAVDYVIYGHGHSFRGTDLSCQASSLCGANGYSDHALGLAGRASGTCHIFKGREHTMQYIDLQDAKNDGYEVISQMEAYNMKSDLKTKQQTAIFQVVI